MSVLIVLIPAFHAFSSPTIEYAVTVTPWCDNSLRLQVKPKAVPATVQASAAALAKVLKAEGLDELPGALIRDHCGPGAAVPLVTAQPVTSGNLKVELLASGALALRTADSGKLLFVATPSLQAKSGAAYLAASMVLAPGDATERIYGLGQGNWTAEGGCPSGPQRVVPLERNGQRVKLQQRKFHVTIPFVYSTAGYGFLYHQFGAGSVDVGAKGGMAWASDAALGLDVWVSGLPRSKSAAVGGAGADAIYKQYADATGHAPALRPEAMLFWQSRNRYRSSEIALGVADRYKALKLPVGVLVIDYKNQVHDGDFAPNPACYPSVKALSDGVKARLNASTVFSFWPEVMTKAAEFATLSAAGCLINADLGGEAIDPTPKACRELIWSQYLRPRYYDQGVSAFWLDETDGEGTGVGDGDHGYDTAFGPAAVYSNLWVNQWLRLFAEPVAARGEAPLLLTRGVWAGGQRHGVVLWSSDIWSSFEELASQVPQGVHASLSGIPWWSTDVGGYGCGFAKPNDDPYMQELIVRWYQFGLFSPIFRTHGCRNGPSEPLTPSTCAHVQGSCGANEVWSYGNTTQVLLERYVRVRAERLAPYIAALAANVSARGVPTMRPLWWEFPTDAAAVGVNDQYMLGPDLLVAPVTVQGATKRQVTFPGDATTRWVSFWDAHAPHIAGGTRKTVDAPLDTIPVYLRG